MSDTVKEQSERMADNVISFFGSAHPEPDDHLLLAAEIRKFAIRWVFQQYDVGVLDPEVDEVRKCARNALLAYMEHYSEQGYAASWLTGMHESLTADPTYQWLTAHAGGHYDDNRNFVED